MKKESERFVNSNLMEGMISFRSVIAGIESGVSDRKIEKVLFDRKKIRNLAQNLSYIRAKSYQHGYDIEYTDRQCIDSMAIGDSHGGILTVCSPRTLPLLDKAWLIGKKRIFLLDGIEDPYNFGYALRSLYASGADGILLPERNWMSAAGVVCRSSAGASEQIPMAVCRIPNDLPIFCNSGFKVICSDTQNASPMWKADLTDPILAVIGGEKRGISSALMNVANQIVRIDYGRDFPAALSAASAATVLAFEILRQNIEKN